MRLIVFGVGKILGAQFAREKDRRTGRRPQCLKLLGSQRCSAGRRTRERKIHAGAGELCGEPVLSEAREQTGKVFLQAAAGNDGVRDHLRMRRVVCQRERNEQREVLLLRFAIQTSRQLLQQRPFEIRQNSRAVPVLQIGRAHV